MRTTLKDAPIGAKLWHEGWGLFFKTGEQFADGCTPSRHLALGSVDDPKAWNDPNWVILMPVPELVESKTMSPQHVYLRVYSDRNVAIRCPGWPGVVETGKAYQLPNMFPHELTKHIPAKEPERDELREAIECLMVHEPELGEQATIDRICKIAREHLGGA